jgi:hypothetical protein
MANADDLVASFHAFSFNNDLTGGQTSGFSPTRIPGSVSSHTDFPSGSLGRLGGAVHVPRRPSAIAANGGVLLGAVPMQSNLYAGERRPSSSGQLSNRNGFSVEVEPSIGKGAAATSWRRDSQNVFG